jgi:hypothetical protein
MRRHEAVTMRFLRELAMPRPERQAAKAERRAEEAMRRERDNVESNERRAAALEAERRHSTGSMYGRPG